MSELQQNTVLSVSQSVDDRGSSGRSGRFSVKLASRRETRDERRVGVVVDVEVPVNYNLNSNLKRN